MTQTTRADGQALSACAPKTTTPPPNAVENVDAAAGRAPLTMSRRSMIMNSVVSVASLTSATAVVAPSIAEASPDAELVELGAKLEVLLKQWWPVNDEACRVGNACQILARHEAGIVEGERVLKDQYAIYAEAARKLEAELGLSSLLEQENAICTKIGEVIERIDDLPAATLDGLRAKTFVAIYANCHLWSHTYKDLDYDDEKTRRLIEANCLLAGIDVPAEVLETEDHPALARLSDPSGACPVFSREPTPQMQKLEAYNEWLFYERRLLCMEMYPGVQDADAFVPASWGDRFHFPIDDRTWRDVPSPSTRVDAVFATAGVEFKAKHRQA